MIMTEGDDEEGLTTFERKLMRAMGPQGVQASGQQNTRRHRMEYDLIDRTYTEQDLQSEAEQQFRSRFNRGLLNRNLLEDR